MGQSIAVVDGGAQPDASAAAMTSQIMENPFCGRPAGIGRARRLPIIEPLKEQVDRERIPAERNRSPED